MTKIRVTSNSSSNWALAIGDTIFVPEKTIIFESKAELQSDSEGGDSFFEVEVLDKKMADMVMTHRFSDLSREIKRIIIYPSSNLIKGETEISQSVAVRRGFVGVRGGYAGQTYLAINFYFDPNNWKRLWSISEYQKEFRRIFEEQNLADIRWTPEEARVDTIGSIEDRISLSFSVGDADTTIEAEALNHSGILSRLHELTTTSLMSKLRQESVVVHFDFPEEVRVPCEQYLLYFIQFLKDLGVEATAELQHEAGHVLFAVTPTDKDEALDKIFAALKDYLSLAASPVDAASVLRSEIEVQRLAANIQHLQGQLTLAHAVLQAKDATIQLQQTTINQQHRQLSGELLIESMKDVTPKPKDKDTEEVLGGMVEIKKYEGKVVNVNLAEIYRRIKRSFSKEK